MRIAAGDGSTDGLRRGALRVRRSSGTGMAGTGALRPVTVLTFAVAAVAGAAIPLRLPGGAIHPVTSASSTPAVVAGQPGLGAAVAVRRLALPAPRLSSSHADPPAWSILVDQPGQPPTGLAGGAQPGPAL